MLTKAQLEQSQYFLIFIACSVALTPLAIDAYLPVLPIIGEHFGVSISEANLTISAYFVGLAIGQFLGGPLSDQIGRKPISLCGLVLFFGSTVFIMLATNIDMVQIARGLQGIGGGAASVICMAQARDVYPPEDIVKKYANIILVMLVAPMVAPVIGAIIAPLGWQYIFAFLGTYSLLMLLLSWRTIPETNEHAGYALNFKKILSSYWQAITLRTNNKYIAIRYVFFSVFIAGTFMSYLTNSSFIFMDVYQLNKFEFALVFSINSIMLMIGNRIAARMLKKFPPLIILRCAIVGQLSAILVLLLTYVFISPTLPVVMLGLMATIAASGAMVPTVSGLYISLYDSNAGSASSLNSTMMYMSGGLIGAFSTYLSHWGVSRVFLVMLVSTSLANIIIFSIRACWHEKPKRC
ncbi:multidrug effflux MFS transporter [Agarilytica rhodophyticola]|uniref:multidrug effflux MFS transporter n=1 Tax=Agarilytica rhodophyticola TaxID=1737490 RepID=UPI000B343774|nr:multidrug effflux MFS transporter [Agarilytica rhodophyticola]